MPKENDVGYSSSTGRKIATFSTIVAYHLLLTQAVLLKNSTIFPQHYNYLDLTAGCGSTPNGIKGAAIAFIEQAEKVQVKIRTTAHFIECNEKNILLLEEKLQKRKDESMWKNSEWHFHNGKYQEIIPSLLPSKNKDFGLVFIDHSGDPPNFGTLSYIAEMRPRTEILIYLPSTNIKRIYQYTKKKLKDYIESIPKKNWLIQRPKKGDRHKWTYLLGTNAENLFRAYPSIEFYPLDTEDGQKVLHDLNFTSKEKFEESQPKLF
jgi:three-Cys-motif partner protein